MTTIDLKASEKAHCDVSKNKILYHIITKQYFLKIWLSTYQITAFTIFPPISTDFALKSMPESWTNNDRPKNILFVQLNSSVENITLGVCTTKKSTRKSLNPLMIQ